MSKLIDRIQDVEKIMLYRDNVFYKMKKNLYQINEISKRHILDDIYDYVLKNESVYYQTNNLEAIYLFDVDSKEVKKLNGQFSLRGFFKTNDKYIYLLGKNEGEKVLFIIEKELNYIKKIVDYRFTPCYVTNDFCVKYTKNELFAFDFLFKEKQWTYTCPEGQKITGEMYEYGGVLAFTEIDAQLKTTAIGIDIKTGNKIWKTKKTHLLGSKYKDKAYNYISSHKDERDYLQILDLKTGELEEKTLTNNQKNDYIVWLSTYKEGYLYCSNLAHGCKIGIIDLKKRKIIQEYPLNLPEDAQIDAPVVTDDKIYVLDSEQVLHIYERPNL